MGRERARASESVSASTSVSVSVRVYVGVRISFFLCSRVCVVLVLPAKVVVGVLANVVPCTTST